MTHLAERGCFSTSDTGGCNLHLPSPLSCPWKVSVCPQGGRGRLVPCSASWRIGHRAKGHMGISYTGGAASLRLLRHCSKAWMVSIELETKGMASILEISLGTSQGKPQGMGDESQGFTGDL